jgi:hypothetical protein
MTKTVRFVGVEDEFWSSSSANSSFSSLDETSIPALFHERVTLPPRLPTRKISFEMLDEDFSEVEDDDDEYDLAPSKMTEKVRIRPRTILRKISRYSSPPPSPPSSPAQSLPLQHRHKHRQNRYSLRMETTDSVRHILDSLQHSNSTTMSSPVWDHKEVKRTTAFESKKAAPASSPMFPL